MVTGAAGGDPSKIASDILQDIGPGYSNSLFEVRSGAIDAIIEAEVETYVDHLRAHPHADEHAQRDAFEARVLSAQSAHRQMVSPDAGRAVAGTSDVADQAGQALPEVSTIAVTRAAEAKLEETLSQTAQVVKEAAQATTSAVIRNAQTIKEAAKQQTLLTAQSGGYAAFALANETARKKRPSKSKPTQKPRPRE